MNNSRLLANDPITKLMYMLYTDNNLTLEEIADVFKVTKQAIFIRFRRYKFELRPVGVVKNNGNKKYDKWQLNIAKDLLTHGLSVKQAAYLLSINYYSLGTIFRGNGKFTGIGKIRQQFRTSQLTKIWKEFESLIIMSAWNNGASAGEIAKLLNTTVGCVGASISKLRNNGFNIKYRNQGNELLQDKSELETTKVVKNTKHTVKYVYKGK